jgi:hypothetical protein
MAAQMTYFVFFSVELFPFVSTTHFENPLVLRAGPYSGWLRRQGFNGILNVSEWGKPNF